MSVTPYIENKTEHLSKPAEDALAVFGAAVSSANPYESTCKALQNSELGNVRFVLSIGKAAVPMMQAAYDTIGTENIREAVLVTKYDHLNGFCAPNCTCFEAGHPLSDENSEKAAQYVLEKTADLQADDLCIVLISGGGSALFEASLIDKTYQRQITDILLKSGADIYELNCVRKRLSAVKGGRLAAHFAPAKVLTFALSDVPGSRPDVIASGPTQPDPVSDEIFRNIAQKYNLNQNGILDTLPPKAVFENQPHFEIVGDVNKLCAVAKQEAEKRGYTVVHLSAGLAGDAEEQTKNIIRSCLQYKQTHCGKFAFIYGGETTVCVKGNGKGGRSQQAALCAAIELQTAENIVFLAGGSDGTDGPTDAAGGVVDEKTVARISMNGIHAADSLADNDAYHALRAGNALLMTGPTGTNVNDLILILTESDIHANRNHC
ncbi:MAG: DUF4147 domain-containing protein [Ruminococcaceae bacterium]|nr:DUF4147 domain-containing protein [Oscillospiraceae bacterium]